MIAEAWRIVFIDFPRRVFLAARNLGDCQATVSNHPGNNLLGKSASIMLYSAIISSHSMTYRTNAPFGYTNNDDSYFLFQRCKTNNPSAKKPIAIKNFMTDWSQ